MTPEEEETAARHGVCGFPCHYGGTSAARKYSKSDLGWMWHCNRKVSFGRCWQHKS